MRRKVFAKDVWGWRVAPTAPHIHKINGGLVMKREDFVSFQAWERYIVEKAQNRRRYEKQGFWCLAIVVLFMVTAIIK